MLGGDVTDSYFKADGARKNDYVNPFYGIPEQYIPQNIDDMLKWSNLFLNRFGFFRAALERIANYFITSINIDCEDENSKKEYQKIFDMLDWKEHLAQAGVDLLAHGNAYLSINQGFNRFLICPNCGKVTVIDRIDNFGFDKGKYTHHCPSCNYKGVHEVEDKPNKNIEKIFIKHWAPQEIKIMFEDTTGVAKFFWQIPNVYKSKVTRKNDKFYPKFTPKVVYDAIYEGTMVEFNKNNFVHLKVPTPSSLKHEGKAIPPCIYMFDDFFILKVLQRFNEVLCYEDINPFRVFSMEPGSAPSNPILGSTNAGSWIAGIDEMIQSHRRDPGSYHKFPFPVTYQQLGGNGKTLIPSELIQAAQANILNAFNIPQEMYSMTFQNVQTAGPMLRLFENSWSCIADNYTKVLQHWGDVIGKIRGLANAKFSLIKCTFADDLERKNVVSQLVASNAIAKSEMLKLYNLDYKEQLRKKMQEDTDIRELQEEEAAKEQLRSMNRTSIFGQQQGQEGPGMANPGDPNAMAATSSTSTPQDILQQAAEIAQQLFPMDGTQRRQQLQTIKAQNETLWAAVKGQLQQMDSQGRSQGLAQSKQQMAQPQ